MTRVSSIFSQILQLIPRLEFESAVRQHNAERHARGFSSWGQFIAMLFCQLGHAKSLREICGGLAASEGKLRHLGVPTAPARSTIAYANEHRPWELYQTVFNQLYARIILDLNRDDMGSGGELEQAKIDAVADAIELHAGELGIECRIERVERLRPVETNDADATAGFNQDIFVAHGMLPS